jgi:hypothetical protein
VCTELTITGTDTAYRARRIRQRAVRRGRRSARAVGPLVRAARGVPARGESGTAKRRAAVLRACWSSWSRWAPSEAPTNRTRVTGSNAGLSDPVRMRASRLSTRGARLGRKGAVRGHAIRSCVALAFVEKQQCRSRAGSVVQSERSACCQERPLSSRSRARKVGADAKWLIETNRPLMPTTWSGSSGWGRRS